MKFEEACLYHLETSKFFPTVADILTAAEEFERSRPNIYKPLEMSPQEQAVYALYDRLHEEAEQKRLSQGKSDITDSRKQ